MNTATQTCPMCYQAIYEDRPHLCGTHTSSAPKSCQQIKHQVEEIKYKIDYTEQLDRIEKKLDKILNQLLDNMYLTK